jgi:DNA polymerase V
MSSCTGKDPIALQVLGDSMEPEFMDGHIIVIEPDGVVENGSYVFAMHEEEYIFRQLAIEDDKYYLKPLNEKYPTINVSGLDAIHGVITQRAGKRRKEHKSYV